MKAHALAALIFLSPALAAAGGLNLGQWLDLNDPKVKSYLLSVRARQVGARVNGVPLSDGTRELRGYLFLANLSDSSRGLNDYRFQRRFNDKMYEVHYIWIDKGFPPFRLGAYPPCSGTWIEPGGFAVLSGDQYTYADASPGGYIVVTTCELSSPNPAFESGPPPAAAQRER